MTPIVRAYEATVDDVKPGERSVVAKINSRAIDRHRTIIEPKGIELANYRANPVVLWEHGKDPARGTMPVGRNQWIKSSGDHLVAKTVFRDDDYSKELFRAYQEGDLRGWSVNVLSHDASPPTREEMRALPDLERCDLIYRRTELAEYSGVAIPSNRDALTVLASRGIWIPDDARAMTESVGGMQAGGAVVKDDEPDEDDEGGKPDDDEDDLSRYITESDGKWIVHAEDGKPMGTYGSKAEARKRLQEIEYFKHKKGRTFADTQFELVSLIRATAKEITADAEAYRDLYVNGRV